MQTEAHLQALIFQYHWNSYPHERGLLFHVNNKARNAIEGNKFKAMGVVSGVSDFVYLRPGGKPLLIEIKLPGEKQTTSQKEWAFVTRFNGYEYCIITSIEEFQALVEFHNLLPPPSDNKAITSQNNTPCKL